MPEEYLDSLPILEAEVGYGSVGLHGSLGYEDKMVFASGQSHGHAISTHPPARLRFRLDRRYGGFTCQVALNDDVPAAASHADFVVAADGREVAVEPYVRAGEPPRTLVADISGAEYLELIVRTSRWEFSHAVWLNPKLADSPAPISKLCDCLGRAEMTVPPGLAVAERCIGTVFSPGFEHLADDMLGSLYANGGCQDALLLTFILDGNEACERIAAKYGATIVRCHARARLNPMSKSLLYSVARVVDARQFVLLDADMLVLKDLRPVFDALDACPEGKILACREGNSHESNHLGYAMRAIYGGSDADVRRLGIAQEEEAYTLVVNDGLFAGGRASLLALDGAIRALPHALQWVDEHPTVSWRNQFIFNLVLARLRCGVELDSTYNVQLHVQDVEFQRHGSRMRALWRGREARVLHFSGAAKRKYPEWQSQFARVADPLAARGGGDGYAVFLEALRAWIGRHGINALAWSFYGLTDPDKAAVRDPSTLPLLATLHYLIRSNGCVRVLETGTARGISTACLASAVAHRDGARVVTLDPYDHAGRQELWDTLPESHRACIESRRFDSIEGMHAALAAHETYHAVLLDSLHTEEHVLAEFHLAAQLVQLGGLILIHDAVYAGGTVPGALRCIEAAGYNVVRLWSAQTGISEDDHLGLAVIENRRREQCSTIDHEAGTVPGENGNAHV
jgi:predicted O-methyltransferase YrrM